MRDRERAVEALAYVIQQGWSLADEFTARSRARRCIDVYEALSPVVTEEMVERLARSLCEQGVGYDIDADAVARESMLTVAGKALRAALTPREERLLPVPRPDETQAARGSSGQHEGGIGETIGETRVYVDRLPSSGWGKWNAGAHMLANDLDALHGMASRIGLKREWFQDQSTFAHYDLTTSKRALAVRYGATAIELGEIPDDVLMRCKDGTYEQRCVRKARSKANKENA